MGGKHNSSSVTQQLGGIQIQTSIYGSCLPLVYGTTRISGNLIYAPTAGFVATPHNSTQSSGKGGRGQPIQHVLHLQRLCDHRVV